MTGLPALVTTRQQSGSRRIRCPRLEQRLRSRPTFRPDVCARAVKQIATDCRDAWDGEKKAPISALSTISPAYMTATRSAISATTPRSCVINRIDMPFACCKCFIRPRIWACMVTSRAVVGSSAIRSLGFPASAIAIITRCFIPPGELMGITMDTALRIRNCNSLQ